MSHPYTSIRIRLKSSDSQDNFRMLVHHKFDVDLSRDGKSTDDTFVATVVERGGELISEPHLRGIVYDEVRHRLVSGDDVDAPIVPETSPPGFTPGTLDKVDTLDRWTAL